MTFILPARCAMAIAVGAVLLVTACGSISPSASDSPPTASPGLLPPPVAISSPAPELGPSPGPIGTSVAISTLAPAAVSAPAPVGQASPAPATGSAPKPAAPAASGPERVVVANTEGQGANLRAEPAASGSLVRTVREGTALEIVGPDREAGTRRWRNVRDPAGGATGWIVADLLAAAPDAASQASAPGPTAPPGGRPPASPPVARATGSPASAAPNSGAPTGQRIDGADRAYLGAIQPHVESLGKAISAANEQVASAGGRPAVVDDPTWREGTEAAARQLAQTATGLRQAEPGPNTGTVRSYAVRAADRADEAARLLSSSTENHDAHPLASVTTVLVQALAEINNMNLALVQLQS